MSAMHVDPVKDEVTILGEKVVYKEFMYLMMNKPQGVLSATEDSRDQTVSRFIRVQIIAFLNVSCWKAR